MSDHARCADCTRADEKLARLSAQVESLEQLLHIQEETAIDQARKLESAVDQLTEYSAQLETVGRVSRALSAELDQAKLLQTITDAGTELSGAEFGAFFYNVTNERGEAYMLYTLSGAPLEKFAHFPMPRATEIFAPTFRGEGVMRLGDVREDPRYGKNAPYKGLPSGHLPVVSYLAVPVKSRSGEVTGGLFFGHSQRGRFTEQHERAVVDIAAQAAIAVDNARMYAELQSGREAAERNEKRYRSLVFANPTPQAVGVANAAGDLVEDSPSWRAITGQTYEEMRGRGWLNAIHDEDRTRVAEAWDHAIASGTIFEEEYRVRTADGFFRWFRGKGVPVYGTNARITEWIGTSTDVNERKLAEEGLKFLARANEMFASTLDYEATLQNLTRIAVPHLADWCMVDMVEGDGYRRLAIAHVDPSKIAFVTELNERYPSDPATDPILSVIRTGTSQMITDAPDAMLRQLARSEEHFTLVRNLGIRSWMIVPLRSRNKTLGAVTFVTADSGRNFSQFELAQAEEFARRAGVAIENARLYGAAQEANRAKDTFLATLSHELRTPMTAILGWSKMLSHGLTEEETAEAIAAIQQSAQAQAHIIEDILDVSRVITGKLHIESLPVKLRDVAAQAVAAVRPAAAARVITLTEELEGDGLVLGDAGRLQQILWNLLSNAIKFTPRHGHVTLRVEHHGSVVRVVVSDTGRGIEPSFLPYVFEPFQQAEGSTTREHGGLGLGLAIVRYLAELHGGRISAHSEGAGRGATFTLELPLYEGDTWRAAATMRGPIRPADTEGEFPQLQGTHVLVIDDQPFTRDFVRAAMRRCGATIAAAASVAEAMALIHRERPAVVLCDIAMPGEDGFSFVERMRSDAELAVIPIIALTAFGRPEDRARVLESGFVAYLKKPIDPLELAETVADAVHGRL